MPSEAITTLLPAGDVRVVAAAAAAPATALQAPVLNACRCLFLTLFVLQALK